MGHSSDLDGRSEFLRVSGEGSIDLAQGRIDYLLRARVVNTASGRAGAEMVMLNGVTVPVDVQGPFDKIERRLRLATVTAAVAVLRPKRGDRHRQRRARGCARGGAWCGWCCAACRRGVDAVHV